VPSDDSIGRMRIVLPFLVAVCLTLTHSLPAAKASPKPKDESRPSYGQRSDVREFAAEVAKQHGFDRNKVTRWFAAARFQPRIVEAMDRPLLSPPKWYEYAPQFLSRERIDGGVAFWRAHAATLARAEREFGVPAEIVVAILGVETFYGRNTGSYRVLDALATLAFDYPRRAPFFRGELKHYVVLAEEQGFSPLDAKGSFAGAMGVPQFMPGSYRRYAVDFSGDGRVDLWHSVADVIGSVANYLARHDWLRGQPVLLPAVVAADSRDLALGRLDGGISERRALSAWEADGVGATGLPADLAPEPVGLLLLEEAADNGESRSSLWIACPNFYVITHYNKSRLYAAAVHSLAQAVKQAADRRR